MGEGGEIAKKKKEEEIMRGGGEGEVRPVYMTNILSSLDPTNNECDQNLDISSLNTRRVYHIGPSHDEACQWETHM